jgi:hypothetical protein
VPLSEATVRVTLEVSKFEEQLRAATTSAAQRAGADFDKQMKSQMAATGKSAPAAFADAAKTGMSRAGSDSASAFDQNFRNGITASGGKAADELGQGLRTTVSRAGLDAGKGFADNLTNVLTDSGEAAGKDFTSALTAGLRDAADKASTEAGKVLRDNTTSAAKKAGSDSGSSFGSAFNASFIANNPLLTAGILLGGAFSQQLLPALGILGAIPALLVGVGAAAAVAVVSIKGIADGIKAVDAGDVDKLETALSKLSPQAQAFVRDFAAVRSQLVGLKSDIQDAFFTQLQGEFTVLSGTLNGTMRSSIVGLSSSVGVLARSLADAFTSPQGANALNTTLRNTRGFVDALTPGISQVMTGFLDFVAATSPALRLIGDAIGNMLTQFGTFLSENAKSGAALQWVSGGIVSFGQLVHSLLDLGQSLGTVFNAVRPVSVLFGGLLPIVEQVVSLFGQLPAPLQSAAVAMLVLAKTGLPDFLKKTESSASPVSTAISKMGDAYTAASSKVRDFGVVSTAVSKLTSGLGNAVDTAATTVSLFSSAVAQNLTSGFNGIDEAVARTSTVLQTGFIAGTQRAQEAAQTAGGSIRTSLVNAAIDAQTALSNAGTTLGTALTRASIEAEGALSRVSAASAEVRATWNEGLIPTALLVDQTITRVGSSISNFASVPLGALRDGVGAARAQLDTFSSSVQAGFIRATTAASTAASNLSTAIQTGVVRAALAANTALDSVGQRLTTGVLRPLVDAQAAYRSTSTAVQNFTAQNTFLTRSISESPGVIDRVRSAFSNLTTTTSATASAFGSAFSGPLNAVGRGLDGLAATAAGVGRSISSGLTSAVTGLVGTLGGPWGIAIAGASAALALLSSSQEEAAQAAAAHEAAVATLADTLDRQSGAITANTLKSLADTAAKDGSIKAAQNLGIASSTLVNALADQGTALEGVRLQLASLIKPQIQNSDIFKTQGQNAAQYGITLDDLASAAAGNVDATARVNKANVDAGGSFNQLLNLTQFLTGDQKTLIGTLNNTASSLHDAQQATKDAAAAMSPAQRTAQAYKDALAVLRDTTADADAKTRALSDALNILAGGTVPAEQAQSKFTDEIKQLNDGLDNSVKGLTGTGNALLTTTGRINTSSQAGAFLVDTYSSLTSSLSSAAAATVKAGQDQGDLDGALKTVGQQAQTARDQFIKTAESLGLNAQQANNLADQYGLIPKLIVSQFSTPGLTTAQQEVQNLKARIDSVPPGKSVTLTTLSAEAEAALTAFGAHVTHLPNGSVTVEASTAQAQAAVDGFIRANDGRRVVITVVGESTQITVGSSTKAVTGAIGGIVHGYAAGGFELTPMQGGLAQIVGPNTWRVIGDRTVDDEAYIPINTSSRSRALLAETARRMGFAMMANGGLLGGNQGGGVNIAPGAILIQSPFADPELVAKATLNELARQVAS